MAKNMMDPNWALGIDAKKKEAERAAELAGTPIQSLIEDSMDWRSGQRGGTTARAKTATQLYDVGGAVYGQDPRLQAMQQRAGVAMQGVSPDRYRQMAEEALARGADAGRRFDAVSGAQSDARAQQQALIQRVLSSPSVVERQAQLGRDALASSVSSQLAGARGGATPAATRAALSAIGQGQASIEANAAAARAEEERQAAAAALAGMGQVRSQDLASGGLEAQRAAVLQSLLQQQGGFTGAADTLAMGLQDVADARERELYGRWAGVLPGIEPGGPGVGEIIGSAIGTAGGIGLGAFLGKSDRRTKTDISGGGGAVEDLLDHLDEYSYRYRDPSMDGASDGDQIGVMAQDLERSEIGQRMVSEGDDGVKRVDYSPTTLGPIVLAALANLNARMRRREKNG